jgi:hypothetical protein
VTPASDLAIGCAMRTVNGEDAHSTPYKLHAFSIVPPLPPGEGQGVRLRRASRRLSRHPLRHDVTPPNRLARLHRLLQRSCSRALDDPLGVVPHGLEGSDRRPQSISSPHLRARERTREAARGLRGSCNATRGSCNINRGSCDATRGSGDATQGSDDLTHGSGDLTRGSCDATQGSGGSTRGSRDSTRGSGSVTRGAED